MSLEKKKSNSRFPHRLRCKTEEALKEVIMYEWEQIFHEEINRLVFSMSESYAGVFRPRWNEIPSTRSHE